MRHFKGWTSSGSGSRRVAVSSIGELQLPPPSPSTQPPTGPPTFTPQLAIFDASRSSSEKYILHLVSSQSLQIETI
jgi:hypothetical protein